MLASRILGIAFAATLSAFLHDAAQAQGGAYDTMQPALPKTGDGKSFADDLPAPAQAGPQNGTTTVGAMQTVTVGGAKSAVRYNNSFECIPDGAPAPNETITIHGQYDLRSTRAGRPVRPTPARLPAK